MKIKTKNKNKEAFTLIELIVVMVVIVILSALVIPSLIAAKLSAHETSAIANLRQISISQELFRLRGAVDEDFDGTGEYGGFWAMTGGDAPLGPAPRLLSGLPLIPPVLSAVFRNDLTSEIERSGYYYQVYLPDPAGAGVIEPIGGFPIAPALDINFAELVYCVYVWPVIYQQSGNRTFFINQEGILLVTEDATYSGTGAGPASDAAFDVLGVGTITGQLAIGVAGNDGNIWRAVN